MIRIVAASVVVLALGCAVKRGPAPPMSFYDSEGKLVKCRMERPLGSNIAQRVCERVPDAGTPPPVQPNVDLVRPRASPTTGG